MNKKCIVCGKEYSVPLYRADSKYCSMKCKGRGDSERMKGNEYAAGHTPWNKNKKGIHLSPQSEFQAGNKPWNRGVRGLHHSPETEFKKGSIPTNKLTVGTVTKREDVQGNMRNWIKIGEPNTWEPYYRYLWRGANGEIPDGMVIHHINFIPDDDRVENLELLTRAEHAKIHKDHDNN